MLVLLLLAVLPVAVQAQGAPAAPDGPGEEYVHFDTLRVRVEVQADGTQELTLQLAALLRTSAAVTEFGQIAMPYVEGLGEVSFHDVSIQKPDGRTVPVNDLRPEDVNPFGVSEQPIAADLRFRKVTIPGLEPGDRLSYRAVARQRPLTQGRIYGENKFTPVVGDPVQTYELDVPRDARIDVKLREGLGAAWEEVPGPRDRLIRRLSLRAPRPQPGPEGPTEAELTAWTTPDVIFTNFRSWEEVGQWWWGLARERVVPDATVKAEAARLVEGRKTPREKIDAIHAFVATRIRYLSLGFGIGRMQPRAAADVLASRYGDCKDKHALFEALAAAAGIQVRPVLVNSARKELTDETPSPQQFDHMITVARLGEGPSDWVWMDGTNPLAVPGYLTANLRDKHALLIEADGTGRLVRTPVDPPFTPRTEVEAKGSLDAAGVLRARMTWAFRSDAEVPLRSLFAGTPRDRHSEGVKGSLARSWKDAKVSNVTFSDPADVSTPFRIEFDVEKAASERRVDKEWPLWIPLPDYELPPPRKEAAEGGKAAEFGVREFTVRAQIELPEGIAARAPLSVTLERPFARFRSAYAVEGRLIRVERMLTLARGSLAVAEVGAYASFRKALDTDREQDFSIGPLTAGAGSAEALLEQGRAAIRDKDYARAADLLRKAGEADPKQKDVWNELGRALRDKGDKEAALAAFGKQVEIDPFDENAYAERAYVLLSLNRGDEAEKDLLKQIEIAPFKAWSYGRMGDRRMAQRRFKDSADYFGRAATLEPEQPAHWLNAAWAHAHDGRADEARAALVRANAMELADWQRVSLARAYAAIGEEGPAGDVAALALVSIRERLNKLTSKSLASGDLYWATRLAEGWQVIGAAALAAGDLARAEKYLEASWRTAFLPEAAWSLGLLRERQQRTSDAARWFSAAESMAGADWRLPPGYKQRAATARQQTASGSATEFVMNARIVKLSSTPAEDVDEEVLILVGTDGALESLKNVSRKRPAAFDRQVAKLGRPRLGLPRPDERPVKLALGGLLSCNKLTNCSLVLDMPGTSSFAHQ
jgi:transglutaminase-like putative cysteine protease/Tfp pilus assembly protein PilF